MMENNSGVKNVTTKVFQNIHLSFTHSPSMMGLDMHVVNVAIKQLGNFFLQIPYDSQAWWSWIPML